MTNKYGDLLNEVFRLIREVKDEEKEELFTQNVCSIITSRFAVYEKLEVSKLFLETYLGKVKNDDKE